MIIGLSFWPISADSNDLFSDAFGPRGEKLNGKQTKFSGKKSPNSVLDLRGGLGGTCPPPEVAVSALKKYNIFHALYDIASIYTVMHTYMITDYPQNNSAERKGGREGTDRAVSMARACK